MKRALCLQGGGAKGAFQAGALKALTDRGYTFDCVVGASVGALNAAMYALGKVDELFELWRELDFSDVLPLGEGEEKVSLLSLASVAIGAIRNAGVDTVRIRSILEKYVDEEALRHSAIRFGLVTVQEGKPRVLKRLFIEDIPQGQVIDFMMASAALPFFKKVEIDGIRYLDGGMMDNLPISMLVDAGYTDIVAIRLGGDIRYETGKGPALKIKYIDPSESPGHTVLFANSVINRSLHLGYYDVLRDLDGLLGRKYYIKPFGTFALHRFLRRHKRFVLRALTYLGIKTKGFFRTKCHLLTYALSLLAEEERGEEKDVWVRFAELAAEQYEVNRWQVYSLRELFEETAKKRREASSTKAEDKSKVLGLARILFEEMGNE